MRSAFRTLLRETSAPEMTRLLVSTPKLALTTPLGYGRPVLLLPGFAASDASLEILGRWLRSRGFRTYRSRLGINIGGSPWQYRQLERRLERIAHRHADKVAIVGHSRGGILARSLAASRPELVSGIITLGSPTPKAWLVGVPRGTSARFPKCVGYVSIYSRRDRLVPWQACRHAAARHVEVNASHLGLAHNPDVYREIARALPSFWSTEDPWFVRARKQVDAVTRVVAPV